MLVEISGGRLCCSRRLSASFGQVGDGVLRASDHLVSILVAVKSAIGTTRQLYKSLYQTQAHLFYRSTPSPHNPRFLTTARPSIFAFYQHLRRTFANTLHESGKAGNVLFDSTGEGSTDDLRIDFPRHLQRLELRRRVRIAALHPPFASR